MWDVVEVWAQSMTTCGNFFPYDDGWLERWTGRTAGVATLRDRRLVFACLCFRISLSNWTLRLFQNSESGKSMEEDTLGASLCVLLWWMGACVLQWSLNSPSFSSSNSLFPSLSRLGRFTGWIVASFHPVMHLQVWDDDVALFFLSIFIYFWDTLRPYFLLISRRILRSTLVTYPISFFFPHGISSWRPPRPRYKHVLFYLHI